MPTSNEISILNVLHGLKHIRDVLNGSVKEFNPHILDLTNNNAEDHDHWEVVDDGVSVVSIDGTEYETASVTKERSVSTPKSSIVSNSNYSWMVEGCTEDNNNSLFNTKKSSIIGISELSSYSSERTNYGYLDGPIED
ncbi:11870_t:CDS:2 [Gigaspora margarita]|uniref:11870_t:CDS:1 n=1 Tax=Gigaspora margarita TaxID=4874 RepID=A0ABN7VJP0_GIGMA|nr:11870_t:CDS:2 [Gigaspora margarita]